MRSHRMCGIIRASSNPILNKVDSDTTKYVILSERSEPKDLHHRTPPTFIA